MKALTLWQPWASLMALGAKRIETRYWATNYRGPLAIHAALGIPSIWRQFIARSFQEALGPIVELNSCGAPNINRLPRGAIVAVITLENCMEITHKSADTLFGGLILPPPEPELSFGDYTPGRYAWITGGLRRLPEPIPCRGHQGLWTPDPEIAARLEAYLALEARA